MESGPPRPLEGSALPAPQEKKAGPRPGEDHRQPVAKPVNPRAPKPGPGGPAALSRPRFFRGLEIPRRPKKEWEPVWPQAHPRPKPAAAAREAAPSSIRGRQQKRRNPRLNPVRPREPAGRPARPAGSTKGDPAASGNQPSRALLGPSRKQNPSLKAPPASGRGRPRPGVSRRRKNSTRGSGRAIA